MTIYVGIDVSKDKLDVQLLNEHFVVSNDKKGITKLMNKLAKVIEQEQVIKAVVFEASGGYENLLMRSLAKEGYPYRLAHANHVKNFAKAIGQLAKTDKLDAKLIQEYAEQFGIEADTRQHSEIIEEIKELVKRRGQLVEDKRREENRLETVHPKIRKSLKSHIKWLDKSIKEIKKQLEDLSKHEEVQELYALLMSVPSVGLIVASAIIGFLPEIGTIEHKSLSALVGLAPFNRDSGSHTGKRYIQGGRKEVRNYLFLSAISSLRWNPELRGFYNHLRERGKSGKVAIVAVMRKLLTMLNSIVKRRSPWQKTFC